MWPRRETFIYLVLPIVINSYLAISAIMVPIAFDGNAGFCYLIGIGAAICGLTSVFGFFAHDIGPKRAILALVLQGLIIIVIFAAIYRGFGLEQIAAPIPETIALYFSLVTWTTLGYGDLHPKQDLQLLAALQAGLGYIFLGLIVGLVVNLLSRLDDERARRLSGRSRISPEK